MLREVGYSKKSRSHGLKISIQYTPFRLELVLPAWVGSRFLSDFGLVWALWALSSLVGDVHPASSGRKRRGSAQDSNLAVILKSFLLLKEYNCKGGTYIKSYITSAVIAD